MRCSRFLTRCQTLRRVRAHGCRIVEILGGWSNELSDPREIRSLHVSSYSNVADRDRCGRAERVSAATYAQGQLLERGGVAGRRGLKPLEGLASGHQAGPDGDAADRGRHGPRAARDPCLQACGPSAESSKTDQQLAAEDMRGAATAVISPATWLRIRLAGFDHALLIAVGARRDRRGKHPDSSRRSRSNLRAVRLRSVRDAEPIAHNDPVRIRPIAYCTEWTLGTRPVSAAASTRFGICSLRRNLPDAVLTS